MTHGRLVDQGRACAEVIIADIFTSHIMTELFIVDNHGEASLSRFKNTYVICISFISSSTVKRGENLNLNLVEKLGLLIPFYFRLVGLFDKKSSVHTSVWLQTALS